MNSISLIQIIFSASFISFLIGQVITFIKNQIKIQNEIRALYLYFDFWSSTLLEQTEKEINFVTNYSTRLKNDFDVTYYHVYNLHTDKITAINNEKLLKIFLQTKKYISNDLITARVKYFEMINSIYFLSDAHNRLVQAFIEFKTIKDNLNNEWNELATLEKTKRKTFLSLSNKTEQQTLLLDLYSNINKQTFENENNSKIKKFYYDNIVLKYFEKREVLVSSQAVDIEFIEVDDLYEKIKFNYEKQQHYVNLYVNTFDKIIIEIKKSSSRIIESKSFFDSKENKKIVFIDL